MGVLSLTPTFLCDQDEQSAITMLKKHQIMEQAVEDYAETVHQLSKTSRGLVADEHPDRYRPFPTTGLLLPF